MRVSVLCSCFRALEVCFTAKASARSTATSPARSTARSTTGSTASSTERSLTSRYQAPSTAPAESLNTHFQFGDDLEVTGPYDTNHSQPQTVTYKKSEAQIDFPPDEAPGTIEVNWEGQVHKCSSPHTAGQTGSSCQDYLFSRDLGKILYIKTDGSHIDPKIITDWMAQSLTDPQVITEWKHRFQADCTHSKTPLQETVILHNIIGEVIEDGAVLTAKHPSPDAKYSTMTITLDDEIWLMAHSETAASECETVIDT